MSKLLDLFSGAGGAAVGYHRAGFDQIVGVDIRPQPRYSFQFVQADALDFCASFGAGFDAIHASPPCQGYSRMRHLPWLRHRSYELLIDRTREQCIRTGRAYVIENVEDAPLKGLRLCGTMFGLKVYRHRLFESNVFLWHREHPQHTEVIGAGRRLNDRASGNTNGFISLPSKVSQTFRRNYQAEGMVSVGGHNFKQDTAARAMGIDWMTRAELAQAIPPTYTEYVGRQLLAALHADAR